MMMKLWPPVIAVAVAAALEEAAFVESRHAPMVPLAAFALLVKPVPTAGSSEAEALAESTARQTSVAAPVIVSDAVVIAFAPVPGAVSPAPFVSLIGDEVVAAVSATTMNSPVPLSDVPVIVCDPAFAFARVNAPPQTRSEASVPVAPAV